MNNQFWQANFWGIVGTITGTLGLVISWLSWRYSHPKIEITDLMLVMREFDDKFIREKKNNFNGLESRYVYLTLDIKIANKKGGSGAIEKPWLVFKVKKSFFTYKSVIKISPKTKSYSTTRISDSMSETETINLGKSFNLKGGEIVDDQLEYHVSGSTGDLKKLIQNYDSGSFFILFHDNFGKKHERKIKLDISAY